MKSFREYRRDALRYRALKSTDQAAPWHEVLGGHKSLDGLSDALIAVIQKEDAPAMCVGGGEGMAGITNDPPVPKKVQRKWLRKNKIIRRN